MRKPLGLFLIVPLLLLSSCAHFQETSFGSYSEAEKAFSKGKYDKAIEKYNEYLAEYPSGNMAIIAHYYIARSRQALGKTEEAKASYQDVIEKYPKSDWADFSKKRLEELNSAK